MNRLLEEQLCKWRTKPRRKPLILRGARQVGKSTLVRQFARSQGLTLNEVNLERHLELERVFASLDMTRIRGELEALLGRDMTAPSSLLFLDEIQATPAAIQALRYFHEELPAVPVVAAGSLLEFTLSRHAFSMPVGRIEYLHLGPMSFREFLLAVEPELCRYLAALEPTAALPEAAHRKLLHRQRQYLFVGGMPEAVLAFQESGSMEAAIAVHRSVVTTFEDDFAKYARQKDLARLQQVFRLIPRQIGKKVKYVNFSRDERSREIKAAIELLAKARVCTQVFASSANGVPLHAEIDPETYKLLFLDVGLMNYLCGLDWLTLSRLDEVRLVNEGAVAEQFVGQHLAYAADGLEAPHPVYWLREGRDTNAEVDYRVNCGPTVVPVEVKAGKSGTLRSLHQFGLHKRAQTAVRFDLNPPGLQQVRQQLSTPQGPVIVAFDLLSLPLYAVDELGRILNERRAAAR